jgi:hypothetical protein
MRGLVALGLIIGGLGALCFCQDRSSSGSPGRFADRFKPSNSWQATAVEPASKPGDAARQSVREARDRYAEKVLGAHVPLDDPNASYGGGVPDVAAGRDVVVPDLPGRTTVVAQFTSFDVVLSASRSAIYSEVHLSVERVLESPTPLSPGATITAVVNGGTLKLPGGRSLSYRAAPRPFVPVPGGRYLLFLRNVPDGDFYLIAKSIELRNGKALPNSAGDVARAEQGTWPFLDKDESQTLEEAARLLRSQKGDTK